MSNLVARISNTLLLLTALIWSSHPTSAAPFKCSELNNQCTMVVGCILGDPNEFFIGEVHGVGKGKFSLASSQGAICNGTFKRTVFGTAKVQTTCNDGRTGRATFSYFHKGTGTGRGKGKMSDDGKIVFWAGDQLISYFSNLQQSKFDELIVCAIRALENTDSIKR